ncbi:hypothetical protein DS2_17135 [Catenovulum agarivorans DS-2]|uniref:Uncharacterized protein n=1 Tax=Catenovulum agarivorans DS-2 TaxID=1328313 RepID=W7QSV9_9ALTE|nr:hypothetical protein [Catenovulum agarivorans]EWH08485.1 hypothetical protein DS2_17135 [Catenovulum agarivorans DS-2]
MANLSNLTEEELEVKIQAALKDNPDLPYEFVKQALAAKVEKDLGKLENYARG